MGYTQVEPMPVQSIGDGDPVAVSSAGMPYQIVEAGTTETIGAGDADDVLYGVWCRPTDAAAAGDVVIKDGATTIFTVDNAEIDGAYPGQLFKYYDLRAQDPIGWVVTAPADVSVIVAYKPAAEGV